MTRKMHVSQNCEEQNDVSMLPIIRHKRLCCVGQLKIFWSGVMSKGKGEVVEQRANIQGLFETSENRNTNIRNLETFYGNKAISYVSSNCLKDPERDVRMLI
jgi:hypothetical protein